jgi:hypothetical protein
MQREMKLVSLVFATGLAALALLVPVAVEACAVCGSGPGVAGDPTARGFYWGILFLMAMPFAIAGSIGAWLAYRSWRANPDRWRKALGFHTLWTHKESGR